MPAIIKIVSGGQTGVDRAALDVAVFLEIPHGGFCPRGRRAEDGRIPKIYQLRETPERGYSIRTEKNVIHSDGTLILFRQRMSRGTELTRRLAAKHKRPCLCLDLDDPEINQLTAYEQFDSWVSKNDVAILNVAGPRASSSPEVTRMAESFLVSAIRYLEQGGVS
ncbi:MAG: putative molybdenum carrier protein [Mariniblastus sp.]|nr:putative molybdenum carrier protein [Mariniblastus sp.]